MTTFTIWRCQCTGQDFASLIDHCRGEGLDWNSLGQTSSAGRLCKHCRPWLQQALLSGQSQFVVDSEQIRNGEVLLRHFAGPCPAPAAGEDSGEE